MSFKHPALSALWAPNNRELRLLPHIWHCLIWQQFQNLYRLVKTVRRHEYRRCLFIFLFHLLPAFTFYWKIHCFNFWWKEFLFPVGNSSTNALIRAWHSEVRSLWSPSLFSPVSKIYNWNYFLIINTTTLCFTTKKTKMQNVKYQLKNKCSRS